MSLLTSNKNDIKPASQLVLDHTTIGLTVIITGDIKCDGDIRIDGELNGNLTTNSRVIIGQKGKITGNISCNNADIEGSFKGKMNVKELLSCKQTARMEGELFFSKLSVEQPEIFNVTCNMNSSLEAQIKPILKSE